MVQRQINRLVVSRMLQQELLIAHQETVTQATLIPPTTLLVAIRLLPLRKQDILKRQ